MLHKKLYLLSLFVLVMLVPSTLAWQESALEQTGSFEGRPTDQIIIQFAENSLMQHQIATSRGTNIVQALSQTAGVSLSYQRTMADNTHVMRLPERIPESEVAAAASRLSALDDVIYAEPDRLLHLWENETPHKIAAVPNDTFLANQWHYTYVDGVSEGINALRAWDTTTGSASVIVAVIDTGILGDHPDLIGQSVSGYDFISDTFTSNDGDGRDADASDPGDYTAANDCYSGSRAADSSWHGTHVAGTIGAASNNNAGVAGVSWQSKILPIRALGRCGGYISDIADSIVWASGGSVAGVPTNSNPAQVINMSLGGFGACSTTEQNAINQAVSRGTTVVVASGNSNANSTNYSPGNCDNVINVASNSRSGDKAFYSNFGTNIDITAPGGETRFNSTNGVLSTLNFGTTAPATHGYAYYQGTSMAAPHVAGVAALMYAVDPTVTPVLVEQRMKLTARPFLSGSSCTTANCGAGIVDAYAAVCNSGANNRSALEAPTEPLRGAFAVFLPKIVRSC